MFDRLKRTVGATVSAISHAMTGPSRDELVTLQEQALGKQDPYKAASIWKKFVKSASSDLGFIEDPEEEARSDLAKKTLAFLAPHYNFIAQADHDKTFGEFLEDAFRTGFDIGETGYLPLGDALNSLLPLNELYERCHSLVLNNGLQSTQLGESRSLQQGLEEAVAKLYTSLPDVNDANQALIEFNRQVLQALTVARNSDQAFLVRRGRRVPVAGREHKVLDEELRIETTLTDLLEPIAHPGGTTLPCHQALQVGANVLAQVAAFKGEDLAADKNQYAYGSTCRILQQYTRFAPDASVKVNDTSIKTKDLVTYFDRLVQEKIEAVREGLSTQHGELYRSAVQAFRWYAGKNLRGATVAHAQADSPTFTRALEAFTRFTEMYSRILGEDEHTLSEDIEAIPKESSRLTGDLLLPSSVEPLRVIPYRSKRVTYALPPGVAFVET